MWYLVFLLAAAGFGCGFIVRSKIEPKYLAFYLLFCAIVVLGLPGPFIVKCTGGMLPDYSEGVRTGYLTKISKKGILWKTWEAEMQVGAALQGPWHFSISNPALGELISANLGKKATVEYKEWLLMPYSVGESGYVAQKIVVEGPRK